MKTRNKGTIAIIVIVVTLALTLPTLALAAGNQGQAKARGSAAYAQSSIVQCIVGGCLGIGFLDANGDGICDYYGTGLGTSPVTDRSGQGIGAGCGFIDTNGDGICDYYGNGCGEWCVGTNAGTGAGFTDADGDRVCDNRGSVQRGNGGRGFCGGMACR